MNKPLLNLYIQQQYTYEYYSYEGDYCLHILIVDFSESYDWPWLETGSRTTVDGSLVWSNLNIFIFL